MTQNMSEIRSGLNLSKKGGLAKHRAALLSEFSDEGVDFDLPKPTGPPAAKYQPSVEKSMEAQRAVSSALEEDSAIFDFDNWKDTEEQSKKNKQYSAVIGTHQREHVDGSSAQVRGGAKYIGSLLEKAKLRNFEREAMLDRKLAREHAEEEEKYGSTEKFITSAYAAKLKERERMKEELERLDAEEKENDVTKRGMGEFYSNLLSSNVSFGGSLPEATSKPAPRMHSEDERETAHSDAVHKDREHMDRSLLSEKLEQPSPSLTSSPQSSDSLNSTAGEAEAPSEDEPPKLHFHTRSTPEEVEQYRARAYERFLERQKLGKN